MLKDKKITVKFYANTKLKPQSFVIEEQVKKLYPLYALVTYNRKTVRIKVSFKGYGFHVEEHLNDIDKNLITEYEEFVTNIIKREHELKKDKFTLAGLGNRLEDYQKDIRVIFSQIYFAIEFEAEETLKDKESMTIFFDKYNSILDCLHIMEKDSLMLYNWVFGDSKDFVKKCTLKKQSLKDLEINRLIDFLNRYIAYRLR